MQTESKSPLVAGTGLCRNCDGRRELTERVVAGSVGKEVVIGLNIHS